ncbi:putative deoxyribonuclease YcfH [Pseudobythopirellula maris]|uniref:Putative deoxyribonuclease YcfH n=1 Tax=Pseudobythopirellula maris TaxID=2527991 RepID=A0A5C5ZUI4_9BACT|nr:TatD family hydrolase [Pseudobythopirellula maris]TWT90571.1 putative deoxyribonuclease YcfH [Pseudobythopirellula maris]
MLFDTHAHLDGPKFSEDLAETLLHAQQAGVTDVVAIGVDAASSASCVRLAAEHVGVHAAVGIQPNDVRDAAPGDWDEIVRLSGEPGVVAIGETGLDRYWDHTPFEAQQDYFDRHLRLSQQKDLAFVVHMRECEAEVLAMLREARERGPLRGVMHSYTGTAEGANEAVELGLLVSFAGMVTFKKSEALREVARTVPSDRLLVETDSPYLSPEPVRKIKRNEPAHVAHTARCLAEARGVPFDELARQTSENAKRLFFQQDAS